MRALAKVADFGRLVRFSHTVFALPFAVMGAVLAARGIPEFATCALILVAMVAARSAAMAMNRLADHRIDAENPRTAGRELPSGVLRRGEVWGFLLLSCAVFVGASALLNPLARNLSPVALATILGYPFAKRFTSLCHIWLGAALGLSPVGAWVAVRGAFDEGFLAAFLLGLAVVLWTAGFDIIYALLDVEFDRGRGLLSIPARLGAKGALAVSALLHVVTVGLLVGVGLTAGLSYVYFGGVVLTTLLLLYEHWIVRPSDLSRVNMAFFTLNGVVSLALMLALTADVLLLGAP